MVAGVLLALALVGPVPIATPAARGALGDVLALAGRYSAGEERVEAVARYSGWRRAQVEVQPIVPVP